MDKYRFGSDLQDPSRRCESRREISMKLRGKIKWVRKANMLRCVLKDAVFFNDAFLFVAFSARKASWHKAGVEPVH